jgi:U3 small nucleolar RNA-associated protein 22
MTPHTAKRRRIDFQETQTASNFSEEPDLHEENHGSDQTPIGKSTAASDKSVRSDTRGRRLHLDRNAELSRTSGLSKSSLFKLQTDELLTDLRPDYDKLTSQVHEILSKVKDSFSRISEHPSKSPRDAEAELREVHGIAVPFPSPIPDANSKYPMGFCRPVQVNVVGSLSLRTGMRANGRLSIDLAVTMPSALFQEKDYLNYRYFYKRAYYISCLAGGIQEENLPLTVKFSLQDGDSLRPILLLEPSDEAPDGLARLRLRIRIITSIEDDIFPIAKTLPLKSNVRLSNTVGQIDPDDVHSTSFYNDSLRSERTVLSYQKFLHSALKKYESLRDACVLGRVWLRQRGYGSSLDQGGFGGFEWTAMLALLFEGGGANGKPVLLPSYSSYQVFKAAIQFLSGRDLLQPLLLHATSIQFPTGVPVLYDGKRCLNIFFKMTPWSYKLLRHESRLTLSLLNEPRYDNFDKVFILQINDPALRFDRSVSLDPLQRFDGILPSLRYQHCLYRILTTALGDRAKIVHLSSQAASSWSLTTSPPSRNYQARIAINLLLDSANSTRLVDHGPPAELKDEAASFREFWGEKAELRRFRDGRILESLIWTDEDSGESIVNQVLTYTLRRHLHVSQESIRSVGDEYDDLVRHYCGRQSTFDSLFQHIDDAFQSLQNALQNIEDMPLAVRQLQPASPILRYTALPSRSLESNSQRPVDAVLQLESSAKWPDDLIAIQMTKVAFLTKVGGLLKDNGSILSFAVGLENQASMLSNRAFLDVVHTSRIVFRLRIHHDREQTLLEHKVKQSSIHAAQKEEIAAALSEYKMLFIQSPRLTQSVRTLSTRFPFLTVTIHLMKHWFHSHLLLSHVREEFVELLTVHTFISCQPWDPPSSIMSGFLRTLLVLSRWNWQREPLVVDFGGLSVHDLKVIETRFLAWRSIDPAMKRVAMVIASDIDQDGITWTRDEMPPKVVAARISSLAKAAVNLLKGKREELDIRDLFKSSLTPYDFIVHLDPKHTSGRQYRESVKFKNLTKAGTEMPETLIPVESFLEEIRILFGHCTLLFHGDRQCNVIGGLWKPQVTSMKHWSLKLAYSSCPAESDASQQTVNDVTVNRSSILNEIARLGGEMVARIEVKSD